MLKLMLCVLFIIPLICILNWNVIVYFLMLLFLMNLFLMGDYMYMYNLGYGFGIDNLSFGLNALSIWISFLMLISSKKIFMLNYFSVEFIFYILILMLILLLSFSVMNLFNFYLYFESSLIPILMLILGWGYQVERLQAGMYMILYTLFGSLPFLMSLFNLKFLIGSLNFNIIKFYNMNMYMYIGLVIAFYIKLPVVFMHYWLPKAHVEAPVSGSMILAGVLLKLGGYGILRISLIMKLFFMKNYLIVIYIMGVLYLSFMILKQMDMKMFIAYSSVVHMGFMISSQMTMFNLCLNSMYLYMLAHGLCSSGLFSLANITFERLNSRSLLINKGLMNLMPFMALFWFIFSVFNMSAPPSLNLWSELGFFMGLINWSSLIMILMLILLTFFSGCYSIYLFSYTQHGKFYLFLIGFNSGLLIEYYLLFLHCFPLMLLSLNLHIFLNWI